MIPYQVLDQISLGPLTVYTWGLFVGVGFLVGWLLLLKQARQEKIDGERMTTLALWIILGAVLGARLFFVVENRELFQGNFWSIFKLWHGGLSYYGGFWGGLGSALLYIKIARLPLPRVADFFALSLPLGMAIGRLGCFLINDHLGAQTNLPWAIAFPDGTLRHPVALYLVVSSLLCFLFLLILKKHIQTRGLLFVFFLAWYAVARYFLDFTRESDASLYGADKHYGGLTMAQYLSILLFLLSLYLFYSLNKKKIAIHH